MLEIKELKTSRFYSQQSVRIHNFKIIFEVNIEDALKKHSKLLKVCHGILESLFKVVGSNNLFCRL